MTFLRFNYPDPEHTLLAKREQVLRLASSHHWPVLLYFHVTAVGAQTALPLVALRPRHSRSESAHVPAICLHRALWVGEGLWLGPQTALDGRPTALMEASAEGRRSLRYRGESFRGGVLSGAVTPQGRLSEGNAVGRTCERGFGT